MHAFGQWMEAIVPREKETHTQGESILLWSDGAEHHITVQPFLHIWKVNVYPTYGQLAKIY